MGCYHLGKFVSKALGKCNGRERGWRQERLDYAMAYPPGPPTETYYMRPVARTVIFSGANSVYVIGDPTCRAAASASPRAPATDAAAATAAAAATRAARAPPGAAPTPARAAPAGAGHAAGRDEAAEARQEQEVWPRAVRPRSATTGAAAAAAAAAIAAARTDAAGAEPAERRRRARAGTSRHVGAAGVLPVHAVAAAEVGGGDAEAARVLLRRVPLQLPDAGARGDLSHGHRRQQAHHHLQRGEPQRLRDHVSQPPPMEPRRRRREE